MTRRRSPLLIAPLAVAVLLAGSLPARAEGEWETTAESEQALERGLEWLARNQGPQGNWESEDLGLVSMGVLAFLSAGHMPGRGEYGDTVDRALEYVIRNAKPSGMLNIADSHRDMYNHGLSTFVLGQAHGMTDDPQIGRVLDRALKLIYNAQCEDGGWDYKAQRQRNGHDLSLAVMQAKAIRSAVDSGLEVPPEVVDMAIKSVRDHYRPTNGAKRGSDREREGSGAFTYNGGKTTTAMASAGVVCMQEFGQYEDWRIPKSMEYVKREIGRVKVDRPADGKLPFDAYTLYYVGQALYQVGGEDWRENYPRLRDSIVASQHRDPKDPLDDGWWTDTRHTSGKVGRMYGTSVACFVLAMPNRYLPILQEGKIESFKRRGFE